MKTHKAHPHCECEMCKHHHRILPMGRTAFLNGKMHHLHGKMEHLKMDKNKLLKMEKSDALASMKKFTATK